MPMLVAGAVAVLVAGGCFKKPSDYGAETETVFMRACTAGGDEPAGDDDAPQFDLDDLCRCAYRRIKADIPYAEFVAIEEQLEADDEAPDKIADIVAACGAEVSATTTTTTAADR